MPKLSELTDNVPQQERIYVSPSLPVADDGDYFTKPVTPLPELPSSNIVERIIKKLAETEFSSGTDIGNKLAGTGGKERYQLWPEKVIRSALTTIPEGMAGKIPTTEVDPETGAVHTSQELIGRAMDMATFAGVGGLGGTGAGGVALGAGPSLRPALKYKDRLYKGKEGQQHMDVIPPHLYPEFQNMAMRGEDISHYNFGFVNDKGHFLNREDALKYGIDTGLIDPQAGKFGALTSTLMADSTKPGVAIEAMAKTAQPFYSAVEHTINNINQPKMTGEAWLGTIANKPGVKPEELDWTGLRDFLTENKGQTLTKQQVQDYIAANKVELKEVGKGADPTADAKISQIDAKIRELSNWPNDSSKARNPANQAELDKLNREWELIDNNRNKPTKYHDYQLPGGENYREMLMTMPERQPKAFKERDAFVQELKSKYGDQSWDLNMTKDESAKFKQLQDEYFKVKNAEDYNPAKPYKSSHWDEPNILAHVRMNDRTIEGKKSLHLEEIQSDWHQQGRDKGYQSGENIHDLVKQETTALEQAWLKASNNKYKNYSEAMKANESGSSFLEMQKKAASDPEVANIRKRINDAREGVPDAPFKKSWHELALKRMLREAAEKGYDRLSWTPGEAQAARYDLSKQLKELQYLKNDDGTYSIAGVTKDGGGFNHPENVPASKLPDIVGKEMAEKIIKNEGKRARGHPANGGYFEGVDLKVGGEGMKGFYDQIIPKALEKLGKEHGVKVQYNAGKVGRTLEEELKNRGMSMKAFNELSLSQRNKILEKVDAGKPVHYIDIPQSLKDRAMQKGFPLFSSAFPGYIFKPVDGNPFEDNK